MSRVLTHTAGRLSESLPQDPDEALALAMDAATPAVQVDALLHRFVEQGHEDAWRAFEQACVGVAASVALGFTEPREAWSRDCHRKVLVALLAHHNPVVRSAVIRSLAGFDGESTLPLLLRASRDPVAAIARRGRAALLSIVALDATQLLQLPRSTALGVLSCMNAQGLVALLSPRCGESLRELAASVLANHTQPEVRSALLSAGLAGGESVSRAALQSLRAHATGDEAPFVQLYELGPPTLRSACVEALGATRGPSGDALLGQSCSANDAEERLAALKAMAQRGSPELQACLDAALCDRDEAVKTHALEALLHHPASDQILLRLALHGPDGQKLPALMEAARRGIASTMLEEAAAELLEFGATLTDLTRTRELDGVVAVARHLAKRNHQPALVGLAALGKSVVRRLRREVGACLMLYPVEQRRAALASLVSTHDRDLLEVVARGLVEAKDAAALVPLLRLTLECRGRTVVWARETLERDPRSQDLEALLGALHSNFASAKRAAAMRLASLGDGGAVEGLLAVSLEADVEVQLATLEALTGFTPTHESVRARMLDALTFGDLSVRQTACEALGLARCAEAVPALIGLLGSVFLRPRAAEALRRIGDRRGFIAMKRFERRSKLRAEQKAIARRIVRKR